MNNFRKKTTDYILTKSSKDVAYDEWMNSIDF